VPVLAEDSSFQVEAMGGAPGVHAGKFLMEFGRAGILDSLQGNPHRIARILSAACWAAPDGNVQSWVTVLRGVITMQEEWIDGMPEWVGPSASNPLGGGFNAIFIPAHERRTLAQIPADEALIRGYREPNFSAALHFIQSKFARRVRQ
jgi:inosine/xanthosine triphosphate pyrophosphatase family protein